MDEKAYRSLGHADLGHAGMVAMTPGNGDCSCCLGNGLNLHTEAGSR